MKRVIAHSMSIYYCGFILIILLALMSQFVLANNLNYGIKQSKTKSENLKDSRINSESLRLLELKYENASEVPQSLKEAFNIHEKRKTPISFYFALNNDYNMLQIFGVKKETDDYGYTHGSEFKIIGQLPQDLELTLKYSTDLFTAPVTGQAQILNQKSKSVLQDFTNENLLSLIIKHQPKNKIYFWSLELGWQELSSKYRNRFFDGSRQQEILHDALNQVSIDITRETEYRNNENLNDQGPFVSLYYGLAKKFGDDYDKCRVAAETQLGGRLAHVQGAQFYKSSTQIGFECGFKKFKNSFKFDIGYEHTVHENGEQRTPFVNLAYKHRRKTFGFRVEQSDGQLMNYVDFNRNNIQHGAIDPIFKLYFQNDLK